MTTEKRAVRDWAQGPLYIFMVKTFPEFRTVYEVFDVRKFGSQPEIKRSHEAIYKWFRKGRLTSINAARIVKLAHRLNPESALQVSDMEKFVYSE